MTADIDAFSLYPDPLPKRSRKPVAIIADPSPAMSMPLLFTADEIASQAPATTLTEDERKRLEAAAFAVELSERRRDRMAAAVETFQPLFRQPAISHNSPVTVAAIAAAIRASESTVLKIMAELDVAAPVEKRGYMSKRLPVRVTPALRSRLMSWFRDNREGRCSPQTLLTRRASL